MEGRRPSGSSLWGCRRRSGHYIICLRRSRQRKHHHQLARRTARRRGGESIPTRHTRASIRLGIRTDLFSLLDTLIKLATHLSSPNPNLLPPAVTAHPLSTLPTTPTQNMRVRMRAVTRHDVRREPGRVSGPCTPRARKPRTQQVKITHNHHSIVRPSRAGRAAGREAARRLVSLLRSLTPWAAQSPSGCASAASCSSSSRRSRR